MRESLSFHLYLSLCVTVDRSTSTSILLQLSRHSCPFFPPIVHFLKIVDFVVSSSCHKLMHLDSFFGHFAALLDVTLFLYFFRSLFTITLLPHFSTTSRRSKSFHSFVDSVLLPRLLSHTFCSVRRYQQDDHQLYPDSVDCGSFCSTKRSRCCQSRY